MCHIYEQKSMLRWTSQGSPADNSQMHIIDPSSIKQDPATLGALDSQGRLVTHPANWWSQFNQAEISAFCVKHGLYCIPTQELIDWLKPLLAGERAIEIGAGTGTLAESLDIHATDNKMQLWPEIRAQYLLTRQTPVTYGPRVEELDALEAIRRYEPTVVIAAWVTHKWRPQETWREGNAWGVEEERIVQQATYVHIGNRKVHQHKPILELPHEELEAPWLVSRAINGTPNFVSLWRKPKD